MTIKRIIHVALGAVLLVVATVAAAAAQPLDKRTYFTFTGPVTFPGVTLPAGKYLFRFVDVNSRSTVQVLSADGVTTYALMMIHRAERSGVADNPEVRFMETPAGMAPAIKTWWYPGESIGYEFVYPKAQARLLAAGAKQPVLTTASESTTPTTSNAPEYALITPGGDEIKITTETTPAPAESLGPTQVGELAPPSLAVAEPSLQARAALPKTATNLPSVAIIGLMLLGGAALLRARRLA
jgi:LPXTG-motif cell wall-anchored protein